MAGTLRYLAAAVLGACLVLGLFIGMRRLVAVAGPGLERSVSRRIVGFVRVKQAPEIPQTTRELPSRPDFAAPPPIPTAHTGVALDSEPTRAQTKPAPLGHDLPQVELDIQGGLELGTAVQDSDATPLLRVQPQYPARAADKNLEGWVLVRFGIGKLGEVVDPVVVDSQPSNIFDEAALRAIRRWKYKPKIRDGRPVARHGLLVRLTFELD